MRVDIKSYFSAINDTLIKTVLPDVQSPFARIQLSFAIDMLNQLQNQVEYRNDVMKDDLEGAREIFNIALAVLKAHHIDAPEEICCSFPETNDTPLPDDVKDDLEKIETAAAGLIDLMYEQKNDIKNFGEIENKLMDLSLHYVRRKMKLRAPTINLELLESG